MANQMLADVFRNSHPDLIGMEIAPPSISNLSEQENKRLSSNSVDISNNHYNQNDGDNSSFSKPSSFKQGSLPSRKSVEFAVLPPPKRVRQTAKWSMKKAIEEVATAVKPEARMQAIEGARDTFAHDCQSVHDDELDSGADAILTKQLAFVLAPRLETSFEHYELSAFNEMNHLYDKRRELSLILEALELVYRASSDAVGRSFKRVGTELVQVVVMALNKELDRRVDEKLVYEDQAVKSRKDDSDCSNEGNIGGSDDDKDEGAKCKSPNLLNEETRPISLNDYSIEGDSIIRYSARVLGHFARVGNVTQALAHFPGLLRTLVKLISLSPYDRIPFEARLAAIWTLANLGCNNENMRMMVGTPGLINALIKVSCRNIHPGDSVERTVEVLRGRSIASRCILNLSWDSDNKVFLGEQEALINLLSDLAVQRNAPLFKSRTVRDILITTRRHAVGALRNLAAAPRRTKIALVNNRNGHLLSILTDAALNDPDQAVTDRAFAAINNLAIQDTAEQMVNHPALVLALKNVLGASDEEDDALHEEGSPRAHASATLMVFERSIRPEMRSYSTLRDLLDAVHPSMSEGKLDDYGDETMKVDHVTAV